MSDLISRKAAIEAMEQRYCDIERVKKRPVTKGEQAIFLDMRGVVRSLPSWGCRMGDLISRQDTIEAIEEIAWYHQNRNREMVSGANSTEDQAWYKSQDIYAALEALPSAEAVHKPDYSYEAGMVRRLKEALSAEAAIGDYPNDLISRSALMEYCSNQKSKSIDNNDIARFPSAEAVEVVRCKDCIRTKERDEYTGRLWCSIHRGYMEDTYYCADGLRREDGEA